MEQEPPKHIPISPSTSSSSSIVNIEQHYVAPIAYPLHIHHRPKPTDLPILKACRSHTTSGGHEEFQKLCISEAH
jgi:hypothetical protein